jgi:pimeloyl-ACP methyl ester carboxylesterase
VEWVLLRGLTREQRHWSPELLTALRKTETVHPIDLPGVGLQRDQPSASTIAGITDALRAQLPRTDGELGLLTISLGGMVGMDWTSRYPKDFKKVVLINTSAGDVGKPWDRMQLGVVPKILNSLVASDDVVKELSILDATTTLHRQNRTLAEAWASYRSDRPLGKGTAWAQIKAALGYRSPPSLPIPSLVLLGAGDRLCHPKCGRSLAQRFGSVVQEHPTAGHDLGLDEPAWVAEHVSKFAAS